MGLDLLYHLSNDIGNTLVSTAVLNSTLAVGDIFNIKAMLIYTAPAGSLINSSIMVGETGGVGGGFPFTTTANIVDGRIKYDVELIVRSLGSTGTLQATGLDVLEYGSAADLTTPDAPLIHVDIEPTHFPFRLVFGFSGDITPPIHNTSPTSITVRQFTVTKLT